MQMRAVATILLGAVVGLASSALAQDAWQKSVPNVRELALREALAAQKTRLAEDIMRTREQSGGRQFDPSFTAYWVNRLAQLPLDDLQALLYVAADVNLNDLTGTPGGPPLAAAITPAALGDSAKDLVYTKVEPCRVVDTRFGNGGFLAGATQRDFDIAGLCNIPLGPATAVALNITVTQEAGYGWLRAWPYGSTPPNASVINFMPTTGDIANAMVMPICDPAATSCPQDLTVRADAAGTHVILDVMGYWAKVDKGQVRSFAVHSGTYATTPIPASPSCANYLSVQVVAPTAGRIVLRAHTNIQIFHVTGTISRVDFGIGTVSAGCNFDWSGGNSMLTVPPESPSAWYYPWDSPMLIYEAPAAGTYTFYLYGQKQSGAGSANFYYANLTAVFYPS